MFWVIFVGGVRGAGFIHSPLLENPGRVSKDLIHVTDWLPTIVSLAGLQIPKNKFDGYDQWDTLQNEKASPREEILLNIDDKLSAKVMSFSFMWICLLVPMLGIGAYPSHVLNWYIWELTHTNL